MRSKPSPSNPWHTENMLTLHDAPHDTVAPQSAGSPPQRPPFEQALAAWEQALGPQRVTTGQAATSPYSRSTASVTRRIPAVLKPQDREQVVDAVRIATRFGVPVYPISRGRNWGYGTANPATHDCAIIDLSGLSRIIDVDAELGTVTLEPGVTQQQLFDELESRGLPYCVPVHGGGPDCSLIGNALERGYGITPHADHFAALMNLEAVLPNGDVYRSPLTGLGGAEVDRTFKWGIGPYLDGLFSQGNFGIVTQATIALAPRAEQVTAFLFALRTDADLEPCVLVVRELLRQLGSVSTSINLMNDLRVLSMTVPFPRDQVRPGESIPPELVTQLARENQIAPWTGIGALRGDSRIVKTALRDVKRKLRPHVKRVITFDRPRLGCFQQIARRLPGKWKAVLGNQLAAAGSFLDIVDGKPSRVALPLAYWKSGRSADISEPLDPAADGCGLRWFAPLVPMRPQLVRKYTNLVTHTCRTRGLDPLITLTSLSDRCFDSTVPLLFDKSDPSQVQATRDCHNELLDRAQAEGCIPYRLAVDDMPWAVNPQDPYWATVGRLKQALDPGQIIAPGRYSPLQRSVVP